MITGRHEAPNNKEIEMTKDKLFDLLERSGWTFVQTFFATLLVTGVLDLDGFDLDAWKVAGVAALLAAIKAVIAQQFGTGTAATLPASVEPVYSGEADVVWDIVEDADIDALYPLDKEPDA